jgi:hypothetical protein
MAMAVKCVQSQRLLTVLTVGILSRLALGLAQHMTGILISHDLSLPTLFLSRLFISALAVVHSTPVELVPFAWLDDQSTPATQGCIPRA